MLVLLAGPAASQSAETQPVIVKFRSAPDILDDTAAADAAKRQERSRFRNDLARLTGTVSRARHDLRRVFNGQAIDVAPETINDIRALPYVEAVYPDVRVHAALLDSAPLIGATQVWSQYGIT